MCLCQADLTPVSGFVNARSWLQDVREHADPHLTCILVGNKVDLCEPDEPADAPQPGQSGAPEEARESPAAAPARPGPAPGKRKREVPTEEAALWAQEEGLLFVETSAKSGQNVELAFERATRDILEKVRKGVFEEDRVSVLSFVGCARTYARRRRGRPALRSLFGAHVFFASDSRPESSCHSPGTMG